MLNFATLLRTQTKRASLLTNYTSSPQKARSSRETGHVSINSLCSVREHLNSHSAIVGPLITATMYKRRVISKTATVDRGVCQGSLRERRYHLPLFSVRPNEGKKPKYKGEGGVGRRKGGRRMRKKGVKRRGKKERKSDCGARVRPGKGNSPQKVPHYSALDGSCLFCVIKNNGDIY